MVFYRTWSRSYFPGGRVLSLRTDASKEALQLLTIPANSFIKTSNLFPTTAFSVETGCVNMLSGSSLSVKTVQIYLNIKRLLQLFSFKAQTLLE